MKRKCMQLASMAGLVLAVTFYGCTKNEMPDNQPVAPQEQEEAYVELFPGLKNGDPIPGHYIVMLKKDGRVVESVVKDENTRLMAVKSRAMEMLDKHGIERAGLYQTYGTAFQGFAAKMSPGQTKKLMGDPNVLSIEPDRIIRLPRMEMVLQGRGNGNGGGGGQPAQQTPWGISRVGGSADGTGNTAWIVDTGIDLDHPDLNVDANRSVSYVTKGKYTPNDENGHGSHVAGTVAAVDNSIGVVGVAANATLVSMRVLDRRGSGQFSWSIAAFDHIAANGSSGDAVNYSVGPQSRYTSEALDASVRNLADQGIKVALAAGNSADDTKYYSPARVVHNNVYVISAMDQGETLAYFSNYGASVSYAAPGVGVYSTYKDGGYATLSGTSMASPHACGILTLGNITADGTISGDRDNDPDPIAHR